MTKKISYVIVVTILIFASGAIWGANEFSSSQEIIETNVTLKGVPADAHYSPALRFVEDSITSLELSNFDFMDDVQFSTEMRKNGFYVNLQGIDNNFSYIHKEVFPSGYKPAIDIVKYSQIEISNPNINDGEWEISVIHARNPGESLLRSGILGGFTAIIAAVIIFMVGSLIIGFLSEFF